MAQAALLFLIVRFAIAATTIIARMALLLEPPPRPAVGIAEANQQAAGVTARQLEAAPPPAALPEQASKGQAT